MGIEKTLGILVALYVGLNILSLIFVTMGAKKGAIN